MNLQQFACYQILSGWATWRKPNKTFFCKNSAVGWQLSMFHSSRAEHVPESTKSRTRRIVHVWVTFHCNDRNLILRRICRSNCGSTHSSTCRPLGSEATHSLIPLNWDDCQCFWQSFRFFRARALVAVVHPAGMFRLCDRGFGALVY